MSISVITVSNMAELHEHTQIKKLNKALHVCFNFGITRAIQTLYSKNFRKVDAKRSFIDSDIVFFGSLVDGMFIKWNQGRVIIKQFAQLTEWMENHSSFKNNNEYSLSFRRNQQQVLLRMRMLCEAGLKPEELNETTDEETLFKSLYMKMYHEDRSFQEFKKNITAWETADTIEIKKKLVRLIPFVSDEKKEPTEYDLSGFEMVFHGFFFLTPLQQRVVDALVRAGIHITFVNLYDERFPNIFSCLQSVVEAVTDNETMTRLKNSWSGKLANVQPIAEQFAGAFEGYESIEVDQHSQINVKVRSFKNFYDFLDFTTDQKGLLRKDLVLYAPPDTGLNERMKEYYPESYQNQKHFLSYPIGQFLFHLHKMWDEQRNKLILNSKSLTECMSSGWLYVNGKDGRLYLSTLQKLLPYFADCEFVSDWIVRIEQLREMQKTIFDAFKVDDGLESNRFHRMAESPFTRLSYMNVKMEDASVVLSLIQRLIAIAETLFVTEQKPHKQTLYKHFQRIEELIQQGLDQVELNHSETQLVAKLKERIQISEDDGDEFFVKDLAGAIALYLGGDFSDSDKQWSEFGENKIAINHFYNLDGEVILQSVSDKPKKIHVCLADEYFLPFRFRYNMWPLTRDSVVEYAQENRAMSMVLVREQQSSSIAKYLLYMLMASDCKIEFSWIQDWDGKSNIEQSPYVKLLEQPIHDYGNEIAKQEDVTLNVMDAQIESAEKVLLKFPLDAFSEYEFCQRRFYYSFIASEFAHYESDFHLSFLASNLTSVMHKHLKIDSEQLINEMMIIFPQLTRVQILENWENVKDNPIRRNKLNEIGGRKYSSDRQQFQFLLNKSDKPGYEAFRRAYELLEAKNKINKRDEIISKLKLATTENTLIAQPTKSCMFCPHLNYCPEGMYALDK